MQYRHACAISATCLFSVASAPAGVEPPVNFGISKGVTYIQSADGVVTGGTDYSALFSLNSPVTDAFAAGTVTYAGPLSPIALFEVGNNVLGGTTWYSYSNIHATQEDLDAEVPATEYTFDYTGISVPSGNHPVTLRPTTFCPEVPELLGDTYSRFQAYKDDLSSDFTGWMNGFTDHPAANVSGAAIVIYDLSHSSLYYAQTFDPSETSFTIPGDSILPGYAYFGILYYSVSYSDDSGGVAGGSYSEGFTRYTNWFFNTRGPCPADLNGDGYVDDADFVIFVQAYNLLYCSDEFMPEKCPADLTNDGYVVDDDFVEFVPAYNQLLCDPL
ncbi:MAG: hypothetical protein KF691_03150 [Phycisphaeraceae bacterium]|nr:hypothetical protein [Phycisphaeraceae bacterium]